MVQSLNRKISFIDPNPAIPHAQEGGLPLPLRDRRRLACQFPTMIYLVSKSRGQLKEILHLKDISLDAEASGLCVQIVNDGQVHSIFHRQRDAPLLGRQEFTEV